MDSGNSHIQEEMREVEEVLEEDSSTHDTHNRGRGIPLEALEEGKGEIPTSPARKSGISNAHSRSSSPKPKPTISFPLSGNAAGGRDKGGMVWTSSVKENIRRLLQLMTSPVFAQAFVLTFLGEWGDRSQITTIAMAGAHVSDDPTRHPPSVLFLPQSRISTIWSLDLTIQSVPVIAFGTILGHAVCTFGAVMGGRYLSTKISVKASQSRVSSFCSALADF